MKKSMDEYESLRNEIISFEEQQRNVWIYMYVLFVTLFVLGLEVSYYLFLVTYLILIPFQIVLNRYQWSIAKNAAYIRVFYEKYNKNLNWESMHIFSGYKTYYKKVNNSITGFIRNTGVSQLGFLTTLFFNIYFLTDRFDDSVFILNIIELFLMILSVGLFVLVFILNMEYNKNYAEELEMIIMEYKDKM